LEFEHNADVTPFLLFADSAAESSGVAAALIFKRAAPKTSNDLYWLGSFYAGDGDKEKALAAQQNLWIWVSAIFPPSTPILVSLPSAPTRASSNSFAGSLNSPRFLILDPP
jgi:hypothetical protein